MGRKLSPVRSNEMTCLCGDVFCAAEVDGQKLPGPVQRRGRLIEDRVIGLEDVGHSSRDVEGDIDVSAGRLPGQADGVVEEDLVGSALDDQR
jgi:hypothetical protein